MTDQLSTQQQLAYILFKNAISDLRRAAELDTAYEEFVEEVIELHGTYTFEH